MQTTTAPPARDIGALVRSRRHALRPRMTQAQLGAVLGYSASWVCRVESGELVPPVPVLLRIAAALGIPTDELLAAAHPPRRVIGTDLASPRTTPSRAATVARDDVEGEQEDAVRRRYFLTGAVGIGSAALAGTAAAGPRRAADPGTALETALFQPPPAAPSTVARLTMALHGAREDFRRAEYRHLAARLPALLATVDTTRNTLTGHAREEAHAVAARAYSLACELAIKSRSETSWVAADRALTAARASGHAPAIGEAARMLSVAMRHAGRHHAALDLLTRTCAQLDDASDADAQGVRASLLLTGGYTAAHTGDRALALDLVDQAEDIGRRHGAGHRLTLQDTPEQCDGMRISIFNALGRPDDGIAPMQRINPAAFPTAERRARYYTDTARMWHQLGNHQRTYAALRSIEREAPEEARRPSVRALTADLVYTSVRLPGVREFAARTGAVPG
ncbi:helix-turn-helix domain-containing protein [Streptomyces mobaraensis]|uniref:Helix-turn-helix transcriptional regulator n=1 Tax=Streptomyces mobaraensis TaxID=35621 RepID=A0A5N5W7Q4_STRMB|nr:helix-turn-helix transcriptional regulator [Streptomyces mobaraensis]KAB7844932.1 helix-turn-helix transcriptional regulator [Streptomyces mobaraensis]